MLGNFVLDHDFRLLKDLSLLQTELGSEPAALLADVMHSDWLQIKMLRDIDAWFLSFPRQPRASMGTGSGISGENRSAPTRALQCIRMAQPAQVLLENVAGFCQHHESEEFVQTRKEASYAPACTSVPDLSKISYTARRRWWAVYIKTLQVEDGQGKALPERCRCFITARRCSNHSYTSLSSFDVTHTKVSSYGGARRGSSSECATIAWRGKMPWHCALAVGYPFSPLSTLSIGGLWSFQGITCSRLRGFPSKALVFPADTILPSQEQTGLHTIGNSISPLHAAFMVHHCNEVIKL